MVTYRNTRTGRIVHLSEPSPVMDRSSRWVRVEADGGEQAAPVDSPSPGSGGLFDPAGHTVAQVNAYLAGADAGERERVLRAEAAGRNRRGIVEGPHSGA